MHSFMVNLGAECLQKLIFEPNVRWANRSIIPAFTQRKGPICVVTGLYHLLGLPSDPAQTSLIKILRDNGFSVVRETADSLR